MSEIKLKSCPFCGRSDTLIIHEVIRLLDDTDIKQYTVICNTSGDNAGCGANCGYRHFTKQDAIAAWNKRAEKTGQWIPHKASFPIQSVYSCSKCNSSVPSNIFVVGCDFEFCPYCGAKMESEVTSDD